MRTSNKILLGTFLATVLIITGIHIALKAKIDSGSLVELRTSIPKPELERHQLTGVKNVRITGLGHCAVFNSDTAQIELPKNWKDLLDWKIVGDSLIVDAKRNFEYGERVHQAITLHLPEGVSLKARYSSVMLVGTEDSTRALSRTVSVDHCHVMVNPISAKREPVYWKNLSITSTQGQVEISPDANVQGFELVLNNEASFTDQGASFGSISIQLDSTSSVNLRASSLEKLNK